MPEKDLFGSNIWWIARGPEKKVQLLKDAGLVIRHKKYQEGSLV